MQIGVTFVSVVFMLQEVSGDIVQVFVFQPDGVARLDTLAIYQGNLNRSISVTSITLCLRIKLYYLHGLDTFFQVHDTVMNEKYIMRGEIFLDRVRPVFGNTWIFHSLPKLLETFRWYHMCFTYDHTKFLHTTYLNGKNIFNITKRIGRSMEGDYALLGQGNYKSQSLSGEITQFNIWNEVISEDIIHSLANCQSNEHGNYLSWDSEWLLENIESFNIDYKNLCDNKEEYYIYGFKNIFYEEAYYLCQALGSRLPTPQTSEELERIKEEADKKWPNKTYPCKKDFFTPFTDVEKEGVWATYYDDKPFEGHILWHGSEPNGLKYENCALFGDWGFYDTDCLTQTGCAFCEFEEKVIYSLRGICERETRNTLFLCQQNDLDHLLFKSYGKYEIEKINGIWQWSDVTKNLLIAKMNFAEHNYPMGRRNWTLFEEVCYQSSGTREFVLTSCTNEEFTCNDGKCIPITKRCDLKYDCYDSSDEKNCELILFPYEYKRDLPPRGNSDTNNVLLITLKLLVESVSVDTAKMEIRVSFILEMLWNDNRLKFINLKQSSNLNALTQDIFEKLWLPFIGFMNTVGNAFSEADREAFMFVSKYSNKSTVDNSKSQESYLFPGKLNPLVIKRRYMSTFSCSFDLLFYPFDKQSCGMEFQILNAPKEFLTFDIHNTMAKNIGSNMLIEYEIGTLSVEYRENEGYSRVEVIVPLKRRAGFAILNIYIPSLCFVTITYLTLFIRPQIFDVRVMGSLTTLLVVATLLNQVSTYLPKTSYFKAIDIWLLFCTSVIFLIIVFHVLIDIVAFTSVTNETSKTWVLPHKGSSRIKGSFLKKKPDLKVSVGRLILISRVSVFALFMIFNSIYWGVIIQ